MQRYSLDNETSVSDFISCIDDGSLTITKQIDNIVYAKLNNEDVQFEVLENLLHNIPAPINDLVSGKNKETNIVNISVKGNKVHIFKESETGVTEEVRPFSHWVLSPNPKENFIRLKGNSYYKYKRSFSETKYNDIKNKLYNSDYYFINNHIESYLIENGITYFKGMKVENVSVLSFDIEGAGLTHDNNSNVYCITNTYEKNNIKISKHFYLDDYNDDTQKLIQDWCNWVREINPSVLIGHNLYTYDIPYLNFVSKIPLQLGRDGSDLVLSQRSRKFRKDGSQSYDYNEAKIFGREIIDTMFLAIQFDIGRKYESYGLKSIIKQEGLEKPGRTFVDASRIKHYYDNRHRNPEMWNKVKQYAAEDSDDALKLYKLMIPAKFYFTQYVSKSFQEMGLSATGSQVNNILVRSYLQDDFSVAKATEITESIKGGISFAVPNVYKNLFKVDLKSCYPSQILRFKLHNKNKDPRRHFYLAVKFFTENRFTLKRLYKETGERSYLDQDGSAKQFINSAYGAMTTNGLNYNCPTIGAKITEESRKVINMALTWASGYDSEYWFKIFREKTGQVEVDNDE